jgi:phosphoribosylformylglycinamidine cyclo-ligase
VDLASWSPPAIFPWLQRTGDVPSEDMLRTFNMGIGLIVVCGAADERRLLDLLAAEGEPSARRIGEIRSGGSGVHYSGR